MITLQLLGSPQLIGPEGPLTGRVTHRRCLALLAVLATAPRRTVARDRLLALFWPESDTARARHNLADTVYVIRAALGEDVLLSRGDDLVLAERLETDVEAFRRAVAAGDRAGAIAQHQGGLLDGVHVAGSHEFEEWLQRERRACASERNLVIEELACQAEQSGAWAEAARWWRERLDADPLDARVTVALMRAEAAAGNRPAALRTATAHAAQMEEEFELAGDPAVAACAAALRESSPVESVPAVTALPDLGVPPYPPAPPGRRLRRVGVVAGALLVGLTTVAVLSGGDTAPANPRLVVLPFQNLSGDSTLDAVAALAHEATVQGLAESGVVEVVLPLEIQAELEAGDEPTAREVAAAFDAGLMVTGRVVARGGTTAIEAEVAVTRSAAMLARLESRGIPGDSIDAAIGQIASRVVGTVASHRGRAGLQLPFEVRAPSWEAYRAGERANDAFLARRFPEAATLYREAYTLDTTAVGYALWEAVAWSNVINNDRIAAILDELAPRRGALTRFDDAQYAWLRAILDGDRPGALAAALRARAIAPHSGLGGYQVAMELDRVGRPAEALRVMRQLDPDRGWLREWDRYWSRLADLHHRVGEYRQELVAAREGFRRAPNERTRATLVRALTVSGRLDEAESVGRAAADPVRQMLTIAHVLHRHGDPERSRHYARLGIELQQGLPDTGEGRDSHDYLRARLFLAADDPAAARELLLGLLERHPASIDLLGYIGVVAARLGDEEAARDALRRLEALEGGQWQRGYDLVARAIVHAELGDAPVLIRELLEQGHRAGWSMAFFHATPHLDQVRDDPAVRGFFEKAGGH